MNLRSLLIVVIFSLSLFACSDKPIRVVNAERKSIIQKGESALLKWNFENAKQVTLKNTNQKFSAEDSIEVSPDKTTDYILTAENDTYSEDFTWLVEVNSNKKSLKDFLPLNKELPIIEKNETEITEASKVESSILESEYLSGNVEFDNEIIKQFKITNYQLNDTVLKVQGLLLDKYGNFINNFVNKVSPVATLHFNCEAGSRHFNFNEINEISKESNSTFFTILQENTRAIEEVNTSSIINTLKSNLGSQDIASYYLTNLNLTTLIDQSTTNDLVLNELENNYTTSMNGLYRNTFDLLNIISKNPIKEKIVILINYSLDNNSIYYTPNDVINIAKKHNVKIYPISIGNGLNTYNLKEIALRTQGRFYEVSSSKELDAVISEIINAQKKYYELSLNLKDNSLPLDICDELINEVSFSYQSSELHTPIKLRTSKELTLMNGQCLALFTANSSDLNPEYYDFMKRFGKVLFENPFTKVILQGFTGQEGDYFYNSKLSLERASMVKNQLMKFGANEEQILIRGLGNTKPIFQIEAFEWQKELNRRVEIKFLNPESNPIELIAENINNEEEAIARIGKWENRGFNAYYERVIIDDNPVYRIKLWGYPNIEEATKKAEQISKKFKVDVRVE